ncbi:hypothetical protein AB4Z22_45225 [Paenibacillus sp. TAF58]
MAHGHKSDEKIVYVGDSRVIKKTQEQRLIPKDYSKNRLCGRFPRNKENTRATTDS